MINKPMCVTLQNYSKVFLRWLVYINNYKLSPLEGGALLELLIVVF